MHDGTIAVLIWIAFWIWVWRTGGGTWGRKGGGQTW